LRAKDLSRLQPSLDRQTLRDSKRASLEATITPDLADRLGKSYILGRYTSPEIAASAAVAGITNLEDLHTNVATQLFKQGIVPRKEATKNDPLAPFVNFVNAKPGDVVTVPDPRTGKPISITIGGQPTAAFTQGGAYDETTGTFASGVAPTGLRKRTETEILAQEKAQRELQKRVPVTDITNNPNSIASLKMPGGFEPAKASEVLGGLFKIVGLPFHYTGAAISVMAPDELEIIAKSIRATTKTATIFPLSLGEFSWDFLSKKIRDVYAAGYSDGNAWDRINAVAHAAGGFIPTAGGLTQYAKDVNESAKNTTFVQAGTDLMAGELDTGKGFFAMGETGERAQAARDAEMGTLAEVKGVDLTDPNLTVRDKKVLNKPFSPGMIVGEFGVDAKLISRGDDVYDFASDLTDTVGRILADPGIHGLDPTDLLIKGIVNKLGVTKQIATAYLTARQAGKYEEALRIAVENGMDAKKAEMLSDAQRLTNLAEDLVAPKENVVYSGDRGFNATDEPTKFQDVDNPDFMPNTENYLSEGLYVTDGIYAASSTGYNALEMQDNVTGPRSVLTPFGPVILGDKGRLLSNAGLVPEGVDLERVALNPEGNVAGVWKFDKTDLNVIDFNHYSDQAPEVFNIILDSAQKAVDENMMPHHKFDPVATQEVYDSLQIFERFESSVQSFNSIRKKAQNVIDANGSIKLFPEGIVTEFTNVEDYINWLKQRPNYIKHLERSEPLREVLVKKYGFSEEDASIIANDLIQMVTARSGLLGSPIVDTMKLIQRYRENPMYGPIGPMFREIVGQSRNLYLVKYSPSPFQLAEMDMAQSLSYVSDGSSSGSMANFQNTINGSVDAANEVLAAMLKPFYDESTIQEILQTRKNYNPNAREAATQAGMTQVNPITRGLVDAGYDGMRYNGGAVIGGTGKHNAYVIWKPSKLKHLDVMSGERFPINQLVENLTEANRLGYSADEISRLREEIDGWKEGMGLIGMEPRMVDPRKIDAMRISTYGVKVLQMIADENDPVKIWRTVLKEKSPNAAIRLAKASTVDEVWKVLRDAVDSGDPNMNIRELPNGWKDWASDTGFTVKQRLDRYIKQTAMMPESTYIMFDDPASALRNTENLLQVVGVKSAERDRVLGVLFKAIEEDTSVAWDDFFAAANETTLTKKMTDAGWTPEEIKTFTSYRRKGENVTRWTLEDLADNISIEWFDEGDGPLRITQLLAGGGWLLEPGVIDELIKDVNPIITGLRKITKDHAAVGKIIDAERYVFNGLEKLTSNWIKPAALGAPLPFRYMLRVIPEETLRVAFSGEFTNLGQYISQIFSGHLNYDTFGRTIRSSADIAEEMATLEHLKFEYENLNNAVRDGADSVKIQKRISKIEKKHGNAAEMQARIDELTAQLDNNIPGDQRALVTQVRNHLEGTFRSEKLDDYMERSGVQEVVTRKVIDPENITVKEKAMRRNWVKAQARDMAEMAANADYRAVAKAMLTGDPNDLALVAQELFSGDLRKTYEAYTKNVRNVREGWDWETLEAANSRVYEIMVDIKQRTGGNTKVIEVISKNEHAGQSLSLKSIDDVYKTTVEFRQLVREELLDAPTSPEQVPYYPIIKRGSKAERNANFMYAGFGLYTKGSAALARNPLWGQAYWKRVVEMMPAMDNAEAALMIESNLGKLPEHVMDSLNDALPSAKGTVTREEVSRIAELHAQEVTDNLLWNAKNNRSYFQYRHPLFFMFFDAYREQWSTWLKLMKNPANLHKVDLAVRSLKDFREPFAEGEEGILHNDLISGQQVVTVPGSQWAFKWMGGDAKLSIKTKNLSVVGNTYPSVGPGISIVGSNWLPDWELFADIKQKFMPLAGAGTSTDFRDYVIPQFAQLLATGVAGVGSSVAPSLDVFWKTLEKFAGESTIKTKKASIAPIMRQLATQTDKYPMTPDGRKQLLEDADKLSSKFAIVRSLAKVFLPASSTTEYKVNTKVGVTTQAMLLDEIRKTENEVFARGGKLTEAVNILLDKYGLGIWSFFGSTSETNIPGLQPTKEFQDWVFKNKGILDKYPMAGGYLGPQTGEYNANVFVRQTQYDQRGPKEPKMSLEDGANLFAQAHWDYQMSTIPLGMENSPKAIILKNQVLNEIEQAFPGWSTLGNTADAQVKRRYQFQDIAKMILDPKVLATPAGSALKEYMDKRKENITLMVSNSGGAVNNRNWIKNQSSYPLRQRLFNEGNTIAKNVPEFAPMWENVLVREFDTTDLKAIDEAE